MFLALSQYMQEKELEWNPQLKIISDWEQVSLNNYIFKYIFRLNVVHGKMSTYNIPLHGCLFHLGNISLTVYWL